MNPKQWFIHCIAKSICSCALTHTWTWVTSHSLSMWCWPTICSNNSFSSSRKAYHRFKSVYEKFWPFFQKKIYEVRHKGLSHRLCFNSFVHLSLLCALVMLEEEGTTPKLFPQMSWYADALRVSFTGSKVIPPPPNFTIGTMQSDQYCSPGDHQTQTLPFDFQTEN